MERVACLVSCGKSKRESRHPAWSLYDSVLFEKSMTAAMLCGEPYIMSAKHGLVRSTSRLDPYDAYLGDKSDDEIAVWGRDVASELPDHYTDVVFFGGCTYVSAVEPHVDADTHWPYELAVGNGEQMSIAGTISDAVLSGDTWREAINDAR